MNNQLLRIIQQDHNYRDDMRDVISKGNYQDLIHKAYAIYQEGSYLQYRYLYLNSGLVFYHLKLGSENKSLLLFIYQLMERTLQLVQELNQGQEVTTSMKKYYDSRLEEIRQQFIFIQDHYFDRENVWFRPEMVIYGHVRSSNEDESLTLRIPSLLDIPKLE